MKTRCKKTIGKSGKKKRKSIIEEINRSKDFEKVESKGTEIQNELLHQKFYLGSNYF